MTKRARAVFQNMDGSHAPGATGNRQSARRSTSRTPVQSDGWQLRALSNLSKSGGTRLAMGYCFRNPDHCASFGIWFTRSTCCPLIAVANRGAPRKLRLRQPQRPRPAFRLSLASCIVIAPSVYHRPKRGMSVSEVARADHPGAWATASEIWLPHALPPQKILSPTTPFALRASRVARPFAHSRRSSVTQAPQKQSPGRQPGHVARTTH